MQQRLIAMVNDKAYFLAAVSHDLRTPLTRMRLRLERLPDDEHRQRLQQNITQMDNMIGQVLDYLRAGEQQNLQQVDLDRLVTRQCADLATDQEPLPVHGRVNSLRGCPAAAALPAELVGQCVALCQGCFCHAGADHHRSVHPHRRPWTRHFASAAADHHRPVRAR